MGGEKVSAPLWHRSGCEPKTSNTDSGVLESFKGALLKDILFHIPTASRQAASTAFHALNSIKLCYWPISLTMSSGGIWQVHPCMCPENCGLEEGSNTPSWEVSIITCKFSLNATTSKRAKKQRARVWTLLLPLFVFPVTSVRNLRLIVAG